MLYVGYVSVKLEGKRSQKILLGILATKRLKATFLFLFTYSSREPTIRRLHFTCQFWGVIWGKLWNLTMNFSIFQMVYTIFGGKNWLLKTGRQSRFNARDRCSGLVHRDGPEGWDGEGGSGWGTHVPPWLSHVNVWQNHHSIKVLASI